MAANAPTTSAFIEKLLAPLPNGEEPADTPEFRKRAIRDAVMAWHGKMEAVKLTTALHTAAAIEARHGTGSDHANWVAYRARRAEERRQCLVPAPTAKELRWKKRIVKDNSLNGDKEVAAAIAADEARLAA